MLENDSLFQEYALHEFRFWNKFYVVNVLDLRLIDLLGDPKETHKVHAKL